MQGKPCRNWLRRSSIWHHRLNPPNSRQNIKTSLQDFGIIFDWSYFCVYLNMHTERDLIWICTVNNICGANIFLYSMCKVITIANTFTCNTEQLILTICFTYHTEVIPTILIFYIHSGFSFLFRTVLETLYSSYPYHSLSLQMKLKKMNCFCTTSYTWYGVT